jgi:hypothetical protein
MALGAAFKTFGIHRDLAWFAFCFGLLLAVIGLYVTVQRDFNAGDALADNAKAAQQQPQPKLEEKIEALTPGNGPMPDIKPEFLSPDEIVKNIRADTPEWLKAAIIETSRASGLNFTELVKKASEDPANVLVYIGGNVVWTSHFPFNALVDGNEQIITIENNANGAALTARFFDSNGNNKCHIVKNEFKLNNGSYTFNSTVSPHHLIVYDNGHTILDVDYVNPRAFIITGEFNSPSGKPIKISDNKMMIGTNLFIGNVFGNSGLNIGGQ